MEKVKYETTSVPKDNLLTVWLIVIVTGIILSVAIDLFLRNKEQVNKVDSSSMTSAADSEKRVVKRIDDFENKFITFQYQVNFNQNQDNLNHAEIMRALGNIEGRLPKK